MFGRKPNASGAPTNLTQNQANAALVNALHKVANAKLRNALKIARQAANASGAEKNEKIKALQKALNEAKGPAAAATLAAPEIPVESPTNTAETSAIQAVLSLIDAGEFNNKNMTANNRYKNLPTNNKDRANAALAARKAPPPPPPPFQLK